MSVFATTLSRIPQPAAKRPARALALHDGDRLTGEEFDLRCADLPDLEQVELIEGVVRMPPPTFETHHGAPHAELLTWLGIYRANTPGTILSDNSSLRIDPMNRPQPDAYLRILSSHGGRTHVAPDGYVEGPPELVAEMSASSETRDLN